MNIRTEVRRRALGVVIVSVAALASGGCVAAVPLLSAAISAAPLIGARSVERTVGADQQTAWLAAETALVDSAFRIERREREDAEWRVRAVAEDVTVDVRLERVTPRLTRVTLRVGTRGLLADRETADSIQDRIAALVHAATAATTADAASTNPDAAIRSLEAEVRRLRTDLHDRSRSTGSVGESVVNPTPAVRVAPSAIVTPPLSAALPSVAAPAPALSVLQPVGSMTWGDQAPAAPTATAPFEATSSSLSDRVAPARRAEPLMPVAPVSQRGSGS